MLLSLASISKRQLRRHGLASVANDRVEHRNLSAVHHLNKHPGFEAVLKALSSFREISM